MKKTNAKLVRNTNIQYFNDKVPYIIAIARDYFDTTYTNLLSNSSIDRLKYLCKADFLKENAYESLQPRIDSIIDFYKSGVKGEKTEKIIKKRLFLKDKVETKTIIEPINENNIILALKLKTNMLDIFSSLNKSLSSYIPSAALKGKEVKPVKKSAAQTNGKAPIVLKKKIKVKDNELFMLPNKPTYTLLKNAETCFKDTFVKTGIYKEPVKVDATLSLAERKKKSFETSLDAYKNGTKVIKAVENEKIEQIAQRLISFVNEFKNSNSNDYYKTMNSVNVAVYIYSKLKSKVTLNANVSEALCEAVVEKYNKPITEIVINPTTAIAGTNNGTTSILTK